MYPVGNRDFYRMYVNWFPHQPGRFSGSREGTHTEGAEGKGEDENTENENTENTTWDSTVGKGDYAMMAINSGQWFSVGGEADNVAGVCT